MKSWKDCWIYENTITVPKQEVSVTDAVIVIKKVTKKVNKESGKESFEQDEYTVRAGCLNRCLYFKEKLKKTLKKSWRTGDRLSLLPEISYLKWITRYQKKKKKCYMHHRGWRICVASACNFIEKETLTKVFSCKFCEISKNTFSYRTPAVANFEFHVICKMYI